MRVAMQLSLLEGFYTFYSSRRRCLGTVRIIFFLFFSFVVVVGTLSEFTACVCVCIHVCDVLRCVCH